jgi:putative ABC transport system permease protein
MKKTIGPVRIGTREEGDKEDEKNCCAIKDGRYLVRYDENAVLLTKEYAEATNAAVGDMVHLGPKEKFKVVGIAELTGSARIAEAQAFIPLKAAQKMYGQGEIVDTIFIALKRLKDVDLVATAVTQWIGPETSITTSQNVDAGTSAVANVTRKSLLGVSMLVLVFVLLLLVRNALSAVAERLSEVGLLRAIGWRRAEVSRLFVLEEWFAGIIGGGIGCTAGWLLSVGYSKLADLQLPEALNSQPPCTPVAPARALVLAIAPDLTVLAIGLLTALIIGAIAGFAASGRASRLDPADALRRL